MEVCGLRRAGKALCWHTQRRAPGPRGRYPRAGALASEIVAQSDPARAPVRTGAQQPPAGRCGYAREPDARPTSPRGVVAAPPRRLVRHCRVHQHRGSCLPRHRRPPHGEDFCRSPGMVHAARSVLQARSGCGERNSNVEGLECDPAGGADPRPQHRMPDGGASGGGDFDLELQPPARSAGCGPKERE